FPTLEGVYFNSEAGGNARLLVTSAGQRVELRQVSATLYQSADSSYLELTNQQNGTFWLRTTDGTIVVFSSSGLVTLIEDRNCNSISAGYNGNGTLAYVADTLGRVINFVYDGNANLI